MAEPVSPRLALEPPRPDDQAAVRAKPRLRLALAGVVAGVCAAAALFLFAFDPAAYSFYPVCAFHRSTGLLCPGCGSTRALHQLLHGHWQAAFRDNALFVSALPFLGWLAFRLGLARARGESRLPEIRPVWLWSALAAVVLFGILRNLPFVRQTWLAP